MSYIPMTPPNGGVSYSTEEQDTGLTWINGKKIYQITVEFGALPNNGTKDVICTGMGTNVEDIIEISGIARGTASVSSTASFIPLCYAYGGSDANWYKWPISYFIRQQDNGHYKTIRLSTFTDRSANIAYFTIRYTKSS